MVFQIWDLSQNFRKYLKMQFARLLRQCYNQIHNLQNPSNWILDRMRIKFSMMQGKHKKPQVIILSPKTTPIGERTKAGTNHEKLLSDECGRQTYLVDQNVQEYF